jgi:nucleoside-diphosphate-sugar epimerase
VRVVVLGGTRFIGLSAVRRLAALGHEVTIFHRGLTSASLPSGVRSLVGDRARLEEYAGELREGRPDVVLDTFAMTEADAGALVRAFGGRARLVVLSSGDVYRAHGRLWRHESGPPDPAPLAEDAPLRERLYPYRNEAGPEVADLCDYDKLLVERVVRFEGATILRLPAVYGPGDYRSRIEEYLAPMRAGDEVIAIDDTKANWRWTRGHVDDVGAAIVLAIESAAAAGQTYNVGEPDALSEREWAEAIGRACGWNGRIVPTSRAELPPVDEERASRFDYAHDWVFDTRRIRDELSRDEAILRTVLAHPR